MGTIQECYLQILEENSTKQLLFGHLPPISKTIQVKRTRRVVHSRRSDDLPCTPTQGCAIVGRSTRTCSH